MTNFELSDSPICRFASWPTFWHYQLTQLGASLQEKTGMSIEKVLAVIGVLTPIIGFGAFICTAIERGRKKKLIGLKKRMSSTSRFQSLFSWLKSCMPSKRSDERDVDRVEIERNLRTKERELRAEAPSKATPEMCEHLIHYFNARKQGSADEISRAEVQVLDQLDREAKEYREQGKHEIYYRAAVIAVAAVVLVIAIVVGVAVAKPILGKLIHDFQGHPRVTAVHHSDSGDVINIATNTQSDPRNGDATASPARATPTAKSMSSRQPIVPALTPSSSKLHNAIDASPALPCAKCLIESVVNGAAQAGSEVTSSATGSANGLINGTSRMVSGLAKTANATADRLTNTVNGTVNDLLASPGS